VRVPGSGLRALLTHEPTPLSALAGDDDDDDDDDEEEEDAADGDGDTGDDDDDDYEDDEDDDDGDDNSGGPLQGMRPAAVALAVAAGSFADSAVSVRGTTFPGLAHFCEHMLFMGSARFPGENELDSYLSSHGGGSNAYTETEVTVYQMEVDPSALAGALDRMSSFIEAPAFHRGSVAREVSAIDSEWAGVLNDDDAR